MYAHAVLIGARLTVTLTGSNCFYQVCRELLTSGSRISLKSKFAGTAASAGARGLSKSLSFAHFLEVALCQRRFLHPTLPAVMFRTAFVTSLFCSLSGRKAANLSPFSVVNFVRVLKSL